MKTRVGFCCAVFLVLISFYSGTCVSADNTKEFLDAAESGNIKKVTILLESGANVKARDDFGNTALHLAAWTWDDQNKKIKSEIVQLLLKYDAEVDAVNGSGETPLVRASTTGNIGAVQALLDSGADIQAKTEYGYTSLIWASINGYKNVAKLLIEKGACVHAKGENGTTPLIGARNGDITDLLLNQGADVYAKDNSGFTALHTAAFWGGKKAARLLMQHKANVDAQDNDGMTPLMIVARAGCKIDESSAVQIVKLLLKNNANPKIKDYNNDTALSLAEKKGCKKIVKLLKPYFEGQ